MKQFNRFRSLLIASVAVWALFVTVAGSVQAQNGELPSARQVFVGGTLFLTIRSAWGGLSADQRADRVQERINHALSMGPVYPEDISVGQLDGDWVVLLKGQRLYTADEVTAKAESTPAKTLAETWAAFLRQELPALTAPTNK